MSAQIAAAIGRVREQEQAVGGGEVVRVGANLVNNLATMPAAALSTQGEEPEGERN